MSILPLMLRQNPQLIMDQNFVQALTPEDIVQSMLMMMPYRTWHSKMTPQNIIGSTIRSNKDMFQVRLDVQHYTPDEITVKTADGHIVVEGKHEEKQDEHGFVSRQFSRRYKLPENCDPATVESKLSSDGVLIVTAPKVSPSTKDERMVPITQTGPVRKVIKDLASEPEIHSDVNNTEK